LRVNLDLEDFEMQEGDDEDDDENVNNLFI